MYDHTRYAAFSSPSSLLSWQRVLVANMAAEDGPRWAQVAAAHNSGEGRAVPGAGGRGG